MCFPKSLTSRYVPCWGRNMLLLINASHLVGWIKCLWRVKGSTPPVFSYHSILVLCQKPGQGLFWSIAIIVFSVISSLRLSGACCHCSNGFACPDTRTDCNEQSVFGRLVTKVCGRLDNIWLSWFSKESWFDRVSQLSLFWDPLRGTEGILPCCVLGCNINGKLAGYSIWMKVVRLHGVFVLYTNMFSSLGGHYQSHCLIRCWPAALMDDACTKILSSGCTHGLASGPVGGDSRHNELGPCLDNENGDSWNPPDVPVDYYIAFFATFRQNLDSLCRWWRSVIYSIPEASNGSPVCNCEIKTLSQSKTLRDSQGCGTGIIVSSWGTTVASLVRWTWKDWYRSQLPGVAGRRGTSQHKLGTGLRTSSWSSISAIQAFWCLRHIFSVWDSGEPWFVSTSELLHVILRRLLNNVPLFKPV